MYSTGPGAGGPGAGAGLLPEVRPPGVVPDPPGGLCRGPGAGGAPQEGGHTGVTCSPSRPPLLPPPGRGRVCQPAGGGAAGRGGRCPKGEQRPEGGGAPVHPGRPAAPRPQVVAVPAIVVTARHRLGALLPAAAEMYHSELQYIQVGKVDKVV